MKKQQNNSTCRKFRQVRMEGNRQVTRELPFYNLDMIISLGYRVKSSTATHFRKWATQRLKEYIIKGFTIDDERFYKTMRSQPNLTKNSKTCKLRLVDRWSLLFYD